MIKYFENFGFVRSVLPKQLHQDLLKESLELFDTQSFVSGITDVGVPKHYHLEKNNDRLFEFVEGLLKDFVNEFGWPVRKYLTNDVPISYDQPWANNMKAGEYFPIHSHNGFISYAIWLKLPDVKTSFYFHYLDTIGNIRKHNIELTKEDDGGIIVFPSTIMHGVNPFYNTEQNRITMSGNVSLLVKENNE